MNYPKSSLINVLLMVYWEIARFIQGELRVSLELEYD